MFDKGRVGLALGGGGARGFAHLGVIKVLEKNKIEFDIVAGTSMGAIIGAAYAAGVGVEELEKKTKEFFSSDLFADSPLMAISRASQKGEQRWLKRMKNILREKLFFARALFHPGAIPSAELLPLVSYFVPDVLIENLPRVFRVIATDLVSGERVVFSRGSLRQAVLASCAVPGAIEPIKRGKMLLSDGGIVSIVPVDAAREAGADFVIAVSVDMEIGHWQGVTSSLGVFMRAGDIAAENLKRQELKRANILIRPNVGNSHWTDFLRVSDFIIAGEEATTQALALIEKGLPQQNRLRNWLYNRARQLGFKD
ncbi:MAG: patatin-like phospholipase family protein [Deltaproteobacteria bacterium]|nr:patatin-like phospholipase family protein [Deltaproteobacteria bacterium]